MAEVVERVAKLEERFDGVTAGLAEVKESIHRVEVRLDAGLSEVREEIRSLRTDLRSEMQAESSALRSEVQSGFVAMRAEIKAEFGALRAEMHTQFRWIMGGLGGVVLAVLVAIFAQGVLR